MFVSRSTGRRHWERPEIKNKKIRLYFTFVFQTHAKHLCILLSLRNTRTRLFLLPLRSPAKKKKSDKILYNPCRPRIHYYYYYNILSSSCTRFHTTLTSGLRIRYFSCCISLPSITFDRSFARYIFARAVIIFQINLLRTVVLY